MHAAFEPARKASLSKLLQRLGMGPFIARDYDRRGAWPIARRCWEYGIEHGADWIIVLNDDAEPCEDFIRRAERALSQRDPRDPVCFYTAHEKAAVAGAGPADWYTTHDDLVGVGCALSRASAMEFLAWVDANPDLEDFSDDGRINLWAMATRRRIYTTVPSLVDHQLPAESLVESPTTAVAGARRAVVPPTPSQPLLEEAPALVTPHLGRARSGNHWELLHRVRTLDVATIEAAYLAHRHGEPVSQRPHVFLAMPAYVTPEAAVRASVQAIILDLQAHGIGATYFETPGDSLVTRGRHALVHEFLCSPATHLLQWDADIECQDATAVRKMVESGFDVVGGAYPWRDGSGRVVANPLRQTVEEKYVDLDAKSSCIKVSEVGTGFLLTSRRAIVDLQAQHPELLYMADIEPYVGAPMWALFDAYLELRAETGRKRYASEDWRFCQLARDAGYDIHVYYPPIFRHWGKHAHAGHITTAWGMSGKEPAP
jgi:hypothetical protein